LKKIEKKSATYLKLSFLCNNLKVSSRPIMLVAKTLTSTLLSSTSFTFGSVQASVLIGTATALNVSRKSSFKEKKQQRFGGTCHQHTCLSPWGQFHSNCVPINL